MKHFKYKNLEVTLIKKHSDGQCQVMRQRVSPTSGKIYNRHFWVYKDALESLTLK